ncbi:hypothetical protein [Haloferula rosea]|uniref:Uncharacterized protein n=1 Tax=Haloferula rosea TaxID=490093 RepID=A0A934RCR0_9BACT|nr:hypothetical protein [Haloferula rosea]MBK1828160.1 hypothetical protein [Haloferula rosea]
MSRLNQIPEWSLPKVTAAIMTAGGLGLLLVGLMLPWMVVPVGVVDGELVVRDAAATAWWKAAVIVGLALVAGLRFLVRDGEREQRWRLRILVLILPQLFAYPQAVIVHDEETSGELAWLQQQHDSMTWLGGDVFLTQGLRYQQTMPVVDLADPPQRLAAFRPPTVAPWSLGIAEVPDLIWWLGYNPAFCQFVAKGWVLSVLGLGALLVGWLGLRRRDDEEGSRSGDFKVAAGALAAGLVIWMVVGLAPILGASYYLKSSRAAALDERTHDARSDLERACRFMPALGFDTGVIYQLGSFDMACGDADSMRARLKRAQSLKEGSYNLRAMVEMEELLRCEMASASVRREVSRMLLRVAVEDANSGRIEDARRRLEMLCQREPAAIQARLHLQLLSLHGGQAGVNRRCRDEIEQLYGPFQRKEKKGVLSASWLMLSQGEMASGRVEEAAAARAKARKL